MFARALDTQPEVLIAVVGVTGLIVAVAIGWALDVFIDAAQRDDPEPPRLVPSPLPPLPGSASLMAAHAAVVRRHADQQLCGLRGHDPVLAVERGHVLLRCTSCGHESPGWEGV